MTYHPSFSWRLLSQWPSLHYDSRWAVCDCLRHLRYISVWAEACRPRLVISGEERLTSCNVTLQETTLGMAFTSLPFTPKLMFSVLKIMTTIFYHCRRFNVFFVIQRRTEKMPELNKGKGGTISAQKNKNCKWQEVPTWCNNFIYYHKYLYNLYSWRWAYRCPKHVEIFMIINKIVASSRYLSSFSYIMHGHTYIK